MFQGHQGTFKTTKPPQKYMFEIDHLGDSWTALAASRDIFDNAKGRRAPYEKPFGARSDRLEALRKRLKHDVYSKPPPKRKTLKPITYTFFKLFGPTGRNLGAKECALGPS